MSNVVRVNKNNEENEKNNWISFKEKSTFPHTSLKKKTHLIFFEVPE